MSDPLVERDLRVRMDKRNQAQENTIVLVIFMHPC